MSEFVDDGDGNLIDELSFISNTRAERIPEDRDDRRRLRVISLGYGNAIEDAEEVGLIGCGIFDNDRHIVEDCAEFIRDEIDCILNDAFESVSGYRLHRTD